MDANSQSVVTRPDFATYYKANKGLAQKVARKVHNRLLAMGAAVEFCDVEQEAAMIMMRAYDKFNPDLGFKFSTYFTNAAFYDLNKFVKPYENDLKVLGIFSMQGAIGEDGETIDTESRIDGGHASPEQELECKQLLAEISRELSPLARKMLDVMLSPPEQFLHEWEVARELGEKNQRDMTLGFAGDLLQRLTGASKVDIRSASAEIGAIQRRLNV